MTHDPEAPLTRLPDLPPGTIVIQERYRILYVLPDREPVATSLGAPPALAPSAPGPDTREPHELSDLERVTRAHEANPNLRLSVPEWAARLSNVSARELNRAISVGALECEVKATGRDHGKRLVPAAALRSLLHTYDAIARGYEAPPPWFAKVRGERSA